MRKKTEIIKKQKISRSFEVKKQKNISKNLRSETKDFYENQNNLIIDTKNIQPIHRSEFVENEKLNNEKKLVAEEDLFSNEKENIFGNETKTSEEKKIDPLESTTSITITSIITEKDSVEVKKFTGNKAKNKIRAINKDIKRTNKSVDIVKKHEKEATVLSHIKDCSQTEPSKSVSKNEIDCVDLAQIKSNKPKDSIKIKKIRTIKTSDKKEYPNIHDTTINSSDKLLSNEICSTEQSIDITASGSVRKRGRVSRNILKNTQSTTIKDINELLSNKEDVPIIKRTKRGNKKSVKKVIGFNESQVFDELCTKPVDTVDMNKISTDKALFPSTVTNQREVNFLVQNEDCKYILKNNDLERTTLVDYETQANTTLNQAITQVDSINQPKNMSRTIKNNSVLINLSNLGLKNQNKIHSSKVEAEVPMNSIQKGGFSNYMDNCVGQAQVNNFEECFNVKLKVLEDKSKNQRADNTFQNADKQYTSNLHKGSLNIFFAGQKNPKSIFSPKTIALCNKVNRKAINYNQFKLNNDASERSLYVQKINGSPVVTNDFLNNKYAINNDSTYQKNNELPFSINKKSFKNVGMIPKQDTYKGINGENRQIKDSTTAFGKKIKTRAYGYNNNTPSNYFHGRIVDLQNCTQKNNKFNVGEYNIQHGDKEVILNQIYRRRNSQNKFKPVSEYTIETVQFTSKNDQNFEDKSSKFLVHDQQPEYLKSLQKSYFRNVRDLHMESKNCRENIISENQIKDSILKQETGNFVTNIEKICPKNQQKFDGDVNLQKDMNLMNQYFSMKGSTMRSSMQDFETLNEKRIRINQEQENKPQNLNKSLKINKDDSFFDIDKRLYLNDSNISILEGNTAVGDLTETNSNKENISQFRSDIKKEKKNIIINVEYEKYKEKVLSILEERKIKFLKDLERKFSKYLKILIRSGINVDKVAFELLENGLKEVYEGNKIILKTQKDRENLSLESIDNNTFFKADTSLIKVMKGNRIVSKSKKKTDDTNLESMDNNIICKADTSLREVNKGDLEESNEE